MKLIVKLTFVITLVFSTSSSWAYCISDRLYDECSDLLAVSRIIEHNTKENYRGHLESPYLFVGKGITKKGITKKRISDAKEFLRVVMPFAENHPELSFYVGSVLRKGRWSLDDYSSGYSAEAHRIYKKQIKYYTNSLEADDPLISKLAARILGNIYYFGLLKSRPNPYPPLYVVEVDYKKAAKLYSMCGGDCIQNYIASVLKFDVSKGMSLLDKLNEYPDKKMIYDGIQKYSTARYIAKFKYRYLWAINNFGMYGVKKNEEKAKKFYLLLSKHTQEARPFGDLSTGEGLYGLHKMFRKDTEIYDISTSPYLPESSEVELYLLHRSLEKQFTDAAVGLSIKYSDGIGVRKDFLRSFAYINIALGFAKDESEKRNFEEWMELMEYKWKLTKSQIIYAQQLSNEILNKLKRNKEKVKSKVSSGTGFYVSLDGHIITNQHVVDGCKTIEIIRDGSPEQISLVVEDVRNDVALLKAGESKDIAFIRGGRGIRQGDEIIAYGYPLSGILSSSAKVTTGAVSSLSGLGDDFRYMQISAPVQRGNSGGPLLDKGGNVVGIVTAKINAMEVQKATGDIPQNINFSLKSSVVKDLLDANNIDYETRETREKISTSDIVTEARRYTVRIQCTN